VQGSMRQRGDSWQLRVHTGRDPVSGRKRYVAKTFHGTKREAPRELAAMMNSVDRIGAPAEVTVGTVLERWYELRSPDWSPRTQVQQRTVFDRYLLPEFGDRQLAKLRTT
jgi:integrase